MARDTQETGRSVFRAATDDVPSAVAAAAPGAVPVQATPPDPAGEAPGGALAAKLTAVRSSAADLDDRLGFEAAPETSAVLRDSSQFVARRRVNPAWRRRYTAVVVAGDAALTLAAASAGVWWDDGRGARWVVPLVAVFLACVTLARTYEHRFVGGGSEEFRRLAAAGVAVLALTSTLAYAVDAPHRSLVLIGSPLALAGCLLWHLAARQVLFALRRRGRCRHRVVVIGLERSVDELVRRLAREPHGGVEVVAACVAQASGATIREVPVAGPPEAARNVARRHYADSILLTAWSDVSEEQLRRLSWQLEGSGYQLLVAPRLTEVAAPRMHLQTVGGVPLLSVEEPEFTGLRRVAKGLLDYGLALLALLLLAPVMLAVALSVRLTSPGPVLFRQERVGRLSRPFRMTKYRSMYVDAEARLAELSERNQHGDGPLFKMRDDPRVTRVGAILRRYSLDELPQLLDVLRGEMSLVGPRPPLPAEVARYEQDVHRRLLVKPGITGLWQVSGRSDLTWEESVRLDLSYVENWSLWLDLSILARTAAAVLARRGAY